MIQKCLLNVLAFSVIIISCKDEVPIIEPPFISVTAKVNDSVVKSGSDIEVDSTIVLTVAVIADGDFNNYSISTIPVEMERTFEPLSDADPLNFSLKKLIDVFSLTYHTVGTTSLEIYAMDDLNQISNTVIYYFNIVRSSPKVQSATQLLIEGFPNSNFLGNFYDVIEDSIYSSINAPLNDAKIDLLFYYTNALGYTIASIDNDEANTILNAKAEVDLNDFEQQNATRFKTFLMVPDFDAITTLAELENAYNKDAENVNDDSRVSGLEVGDIFGFTLDIRRGSKIGLIKVIAAGDTETSGAIKIQVKTEPDTSDELPL